MNKLELIKHGFMESEAIVHKTTSYLCDTISKVKDKERVNAFNVMYSIMRVVDDMVDERKDNSKETINKIKKEIAKWKELVDKCYEQNPDPTPISLAFSDSLSKFRVPKKVWDAFFSSMVGDLNRKDFKNFPDFEKYCFGATCAPTIIYLFILLSKKNGDIYELRDFDYLKTGYNLGIWAYLVHILRDVKKDASCNLFYLPENEIAKFGLSKKDIFEFSKKGTGNLRYKDFVNYYLKKAKGYYLSSIKDTEKCLEKMPKDRAFAVLIILKIYEEIGKRLQVIGERVFSGEKVLPAEDYRSIEEDLIKRMGMENG